MSYSDTAEIVEPGSKKRVREQRDDSYGLHKTFDLEVGTQVFPVTYDGNSLNVSGSGNLPVVSIDAHTCQAGDGLFSLANGESEQVMARKLVNELSEKFAQLYANNVTMQRLAIEAAIVPLGCAKEYTRVSESDKRPSLSNMYLGERVFDTIGRAYAGQRMRWTVRQFGPTIKSNTHGKSDIANSYGIYLTPVDVLDVGAKFSAAAENLITDFATWESALAGFPGVAEPWTAAVFADDRHMKFAGIAMVEALLRKGILRVNTNEDRDKHVKNVEPENGPVRVPVELLDTSQILNKNLYSYEVAAIIADLIGLTTPQDSKVGMLDAEGLKTYAELAHGLTKTLFYTAQSGRVDASAEFGARWTPSGPQFAGRHNGNMEVMDTSVGAVVQLQIKHQQAAVSAFRHAIAHDDKMMGGTAISNTSGGSTVVALHK